jgi:hypothetical protein
VTTASPCTGNFRPSFIWGQNHSESSKQIKKSTFSFADINASRNLATSSSSLSISRPVVAAASIKHFTLDCVDSIPVQNRVRVSRWVPSCLDMALMELCIFVQDSLMSLISEANSALALASTVSYCKSFNNTATYFAIPGVMSGFVSAASKLSLMPRSIRRWSGLGHFIGHEDLASSNNPVHPAQST